MFWYYHISKPGGSSNFHAGSNPQHEDEFMSKAKEVHSTPSNVVALSDFRKNISRGKITPPPQKSVAGSKHPSREAVRLSYKSDDPIFFEIERHRHAVETYKKLCDAGSEAERTATDEELAELERCIDQAFDDLYLFTRCMVTLPAKSRAGLIALVRYLEQRCSDPFGDPYMPERPDDEPWLRVFMRVLASSLRKMGKDFPPAKRSRRGKAVRL